PLVGGMEEIKGALVSVERKENKTVYELALPFSEFDISLGSGSYARLGLIINDLDVTEQRKWMGVKDPVYVGIVKEPTNMPVLHFE
ncbi:MAG: hypothetical protein KBT47_05940, partial [Armatimonadetes bacterium]|nr:hypothetical protein [Candidatus Hippobium faecium]